MDILALNEKPQPGLYNLAFYDYLSLKAVSRSDLSALRKSPAHAKWAKENPSKSTPALEFGEAFHCRLLEPKRFEAEYVVAPKFDRRTKVGKAAADEFAATHGGKSLIDAEDLVSVEEMFARVSDLEIGGKLLSVIATPESSIVWKDEPTGLICKGRIDADAPALNSLIDIKTTESAERQAFEQSIFKFGYHRQAAFYLDGMAAIGKPRAHFVIIAVEKSGPYSAALYRLKDEVIELGRRENRELLNLWKRCEESENWPGYPDKIQDIGIPAWAKRQIEENIGF
jgi:hypothetical protein